MSPTERYHRIAEIMDEAYRSYEEGLVALRKRLVDDMKRKLKEGGVLDRSHVEQPSLRDRPAPARHPRARGRRPRG